MGRHTPALQADGRRRRGPVPVAAALAVVVLGALGWAATRPGAVAGFASGAGFDAGSDVAAPADAPADAPAEVASGCRVDATVRVTVAPVLGELVREALSSPVPMGGDRCAVAEVRTEEPLQTLGVLADGDADGDGDPVGQPQVWVPDDVSWATRAGAVVDPAFAELAATPVVLATSRAVADALGWTTTPPTWAQALLSVGAVLPDPGTEAAGVVALAALGSSAGPDALDAAVLEAGRTGSTVQEALTAAVAGDPAAPVVVVTEQQVAAASTAGPGQLVVVVPAEGAPTLVAPVLRTAAGRADAGAGAGADAGAGTGAVDVVLDRLAAVASDGAAVRAGGWRDAIGRFEGGAPPPPALPLTADAVLGVLARVADRTGAP